MVYTLITMLMSNVEKVTFILVLIVYARSTLIVVLLYTYALMLICLYLHHDANVYLHPYANVLVEEVLDGKVTLHRRTHHHTAKVKTEGIWIYITKQCLHVTIQYSGKFSLVQNFAKMLYSL